MDMYSYGKVYQLLALRQHTFNALLVGENIMKSSCYRQLGPDLTQIGGITFPLWLHSYIALLLQ